MTTAPHHELLLGGARSGKSRTAEGRAADWLAADARHHATLVATALPGDEEMAARIARHRLDRAARVPALATVEAPRHLAATLRGLDGPRHLVVVDCLTVWLTQWLLPPEGLAASPEGWQQERDGLLSALGSCRSPVVLVSNEIGLGVLPMAREARACVDALGRLHQDLAAACSRVTLMVAGCELTVKDLR
jgi:adenosylcobinamide kinase / adenosylcobinamide-phosphate guanylyltransferase